MATKRMIETSIWRKSRKFKKLQPLEKLLYIYLLSNEDTELCGAYELELDEMAYHTGLDHRTLPETIRRLEEVGLIRYIDGWVVIFNYKAAVNNPSVRKGIQAGLDALPDHILALVQGQQPDIEASGRIGSSKRERVKARDGNKCILCESTDNLEVHHVAAVAEGGSASDDNLVTLCRECHQKVHHNEESKSVLMSIKEYQERIRESDILSQNGTSSDTMSLLYDSDSDYDYDSELELRSAPAGMSPMKDEVANLWQSELLSVQPESTWSNFAKERAMLNVLAKKTRLLVSQTKLESPEEAVRAILATFKKARQTEKSSYWRDAPFIPSEVVKKWPDLTTRLAGDYERNQFEGRGIEALDRLGG